MTNHKFLKTTLLLFLTFTVLFLMSVPNVWFLSIVKASPDPDWLDYNYRQQCDFSGATGAGSNYPMFFNVYRGEGTSSGNSLYLNNHNMSTFPNDLNFTDNDGTTPLDHWVENSNSTWAAVWVEVADSLSSGTVPIYIYYGKSGVSSGSNGTATFSFFFDDCSSTSGWTWRTGIGSIQASDGIITLTDATDTSRWYKSPSFPTTWSLEWRMQVGGGGTEDEGQMVIHPSVFGAVLQNSLRRNNNRHYYCYQDSGVWQYPNTNPSPAIANDTWYVCSLINRNATYTVYDALEDDRGSWDSPAHDHDNVSPVYVELGIYKGVTKFDWIFMRTYVDPEPSYAGWGEEEERPIAPTVDNIGYTSTVTSENCTFSSYWTAVDPKNMSGFILGCNVSGTFQNETWTALSGRSAWANKTKPLPSEDFTLVKYQFWANDTNDEWGTTGGEYLITSSEWLSGWQHRTQILINNTGGVLTNYSVSFELDANSLMGDSKMLWDAGDIRVTDINSSTLLSYWLDDKWIYTSTMKIWTKIPTITANTYTGIYTYYGKTGVSTTENMSNVFDLGRDFNDGSTSGLTIRTVDNASLEVPSVSHLFSKLYVENWARHPENPILSATESWEDDHNRDPNLLTDGYGNLVKYNETYVIFYSARLAANGGGIGRAESTDGIHWTKNPTNPCIEAPESGYGSEFILRPQAIKRGENDYICYFHGRLGGASGNRTCLYALSSNTINWTIHNETPLTFSSNFTGDSATFTRCIELLNGSFLMTFEGLISGEWESFGALSSNWTTPFTPINNGNAILTKGTEGSYDDDGCANPQPLQLASEAFIMAYDGCATAHTQFSHCFATATTDITNWTKFSGNPVMWGDMDYWEKERIEYGGGFYQDDIEAGILRKWYFAYLNYPANDDCKIGFASCKQPNRVLFGSNCSVAGDAYLWGHDLDSLDEFMAQVDVDGSRDDTDTTSAMTLLGLTNNASVPNIGAIGDRVFSVGRLSYAHTSGYGDFYIVYKDTGDTVRYWTGSAWQTGATYLGNRGTFRVKMWDDGTNYKADILDFTGGSILTSVASIAKSSVKNCSDGRVLIGGELLTSHYYQTQEWDNLIIGNYTSPEPTSILGSEEEGFSCEITIITTTHSWNLTPGQSDILINEGAITVNVTANANYDLQVKGSGDLTYTTHTIALSNVKVHKDTLSSAIELSTAYQDLPGLTNQPSGTNVQHTFKLWLTCPTGKPHGTYTYTLYIQVVEAG